MFFKFYHLVRNYFCFFWKILFMLNCALRFPGDSNCTKLCFTLILPLGMLSRKERLLNVIPKWRLSLHNFFQLVQRVKKQVFDMKHFETPWFFGHFHSNYPKCKPSLRLFIFFPDFLILMQKFNRTPNFQPPCYLLEQFLLIEFTMDLGQFFAGKSFRIFFHHFYLLRNNVKSRKPLLLFSAIWQPHYL